MFLFVAVLLDRDIRPFLPAQRNRVIAGGFTEKVDDRVPRIAAHGIGETPAVHVGAVLARHAFVAFQKRFETVFADDATEIREALGVAVDPAPFVREPNRFRALTLRSVHHFHLLRVAPARLKELLMVR